MKYKGKQRALERANRNTYFFQSTPYLATKSPCDWFGLYYCSINTLVAKSPIKFIIYYISRLGLIVLHL